MEVWTAAGLRSEEEYRRFLEAYARSASLRVGSW